MKAMGTIATTLTATLVILAILARLDVGERRFYGAVETGLLVIVISFLGAVVVTLTAVLIHVRGEARAKVIRAGQPPERHVFHLQKHTIDGRGTTNVTGTDPLMYPDLVRQLLAAQQGVAGPQLGAGQQAMWQLPAPAGRQVARMEDVAPVLDDSDWTPYGEMAGDW